MSLENKILKIQRNSRASCIEIKIIPVKKRRVYIVSEFGKIMNIPIKPHNVKDIFRINSRNPKYKTKITDLEKLINKKIS